jgi:signal transduction histidine kinase
MTIAMVTSLGEAIAVALIIGALVEIMRRSRATGVPGSRGVGYVVAGFALLLIGTAADFASDLLAVRAESASPWITAALDVTVFATRIAGLLAILRGILTWLPLLRSLSAEASNKASALAETQQRLAAVAAHLPGVIFQTIHHPDGRAELPYIDGNVVHLIGLEPGQATADPQRLWQRIDGEDAQAAAKRVASVGDAPATVSFELRYTGREGQTRWMICHGIAARRDDGAVVLDGIALDVGPQKLAQQRAAAAEALLVDAIDSTDEGFAVYGADGRLSAFNKDYRARLPAELRFEIGDHFDDITRRIMASGARIMSVDNQLLPKGQTLPMSRFLAGPVEQLLADGRWLRVATRPTRAGGVVVTTTDITERKRRERQIADSVAQMTAIVDNMPVGVAMYDAESRLLACNERFRQLIKLPRDLTLPGTPLQRFMTYVAERGDFGDQDREATIARLTNAVRIGPVSAEISVPGGRMMEMYSSTMPGGGLIVAFSDITERKRIQEAERRAMQALAEAARAKSDFLANMSHELRTPLNAIIGFSEVMTAQLLGPLADRYREYAADITHSARHLLALISDILDLSKVEAGRMELAEQPVDLAEAMTACITMVSPAADKGKITVAADLPPDLPQVRGDRRRIVQVLLNLLTNAVKFTREGGRVTLAARAEADGVTIRIADTGIGIAAEDLPRVMQDWGQARSDLTRDGEGTGLGLPLSRRLMELHQGTLQLESRLGEGTTVTLWFPSQRLLASAAAAAAAGAGAEASVAPEAATASTAQASVPPAADPS